MHLTLLARAHCPLCDRMLEAAQALAATYGVAVRVVDVDGDRELAEEWGAFVPVLLAGDPADNVELCHYHFDLAKVENILRQASADSPLPPAPPESA